MGAKPPLYPEIAKLAQEAAGSPQFSKPQANDIQKVPQICKALDQSSRPAEVRVSGQVQDRQCLYGQLYLTPTPLLGGKAKIPPTPPSCQQPHVDLEAIVALHRELRDICAGAQINLTIQLICLEQEDQ